MALDRGIQTSHRGRDRLCLPTNRSHLALLFQHLRSLFGAMQSLPLSHDIPARSQEPPELLEVNAILKFEKFGFLVLNTYKHASFQTCTFVAVL